MATTNGQHLALPKNSLILVTGATGYIASNIIAEALSIGYRVRGTIRSQSKANETAKVFSSPRYETAIVSDMASPGAFDEAVKGVDAIIHTASVMSFSPNPHDVVLATVAGAAGILASAAKEKSVKRFVYTSSSTAATIPKPNQRFKITKDTWNDEALVEAWKPPPYGDDRAFAVYAASKTEAERAVWKFVEEEKPSFTVNCVLPNANMGRVLASPGATGDWVRSVFLGNVPVDSPPQWMIDVIDDARIHIAAAIDVSLANERIFAFAHPYNWNDIIDAVQKARPDKELPKHISDQARDLSEPDNDLGAQLLRKWWNQDGYKSLEQSVKENLEGLA
ncbi:NAD(P)-binding protein [Lepidopterella palustris CBS 459.81]|uniref:NAD(P)-binding protein n=1 Tax=Lepidopterella palustris CBS 459.81 TaxID=1314670 RepID=A0A8E2JG60_9PEZI|nr:NAD(P)-binding protein [Lepidopterella palustris CBS 459.81]